MSWHWIYDWKKLFICLFILGFTDRQDYFYSSWAESIVRWGENGRPPKTTWPPASRIRLVSHVTGLGSNSQRLDHERFRALKISVLNYSAKGPEKLSDKLKIKKSKQKHHLEIRDIFSKHLLRPETWTDPEILPGKIEVGRRVSHT